MSMCFSNPACAGCKLHHYDWDTGSEWCDKEEVLTEEEYNAYTEGDLQECALHEDEEDDGYDYCFHDPETSYPYIDVEDVEEDYL